MQTLERHDIAKLEGYIKNIKQYRKELKFRGYELLENHDPENIGAGKSNMPGNPIEREVLKRFSDKKYNNLDNIVSSVEKLINTVDDDSLEAMKLKYWHEQGAYLTWEDVANEYNMSRTAMTNRRNAWLMMLADYMDYV
ncbi:transcriptional regulator [Staphylococcus equorum]|uniref:transcriptional regulator n=1 Tax=Staphylococcus equorum TaxID=246432 RepID=UPI002553419E|nr:transcriptional regulator [Staphylococcus equorum]MDK9869959.1 transcriptional regulator [Staphylococcus equorum]